MSIKKCVSNAWQEIEKLQKYLSGAWQSCASAKKYANGAWTSVWDDKLYLIQNGTFVADFLKYDNTYAKVSEENSYGQQPYILVKATSNSQYGYGGMVFNFPLKDVHGKTLYINGLCYKTGDNYPYYLGWSTYNTAGRRNIGESNYTVASIPIVSEYYGDEYKDYYFEVSVGCYYADSSFVSYRIYDMYIQ